MRLFFFGLCIATITQTAFAISIGSIADSLESRSAPITNNISAKTNEPTMQAYTTKTTSQQEKIAVAMPQKNTAAPSSLPNPALFVEDSAMTAYLNAKLMFKRDIPSVNVNTVNSIVYLRGKVNSQEQVDTLVTVAMSVKGVKAVNTDELVIS